MGKIMNIGLLAAMEPELEFLHQTLKKKKIPFQYNEDLQIYCYSLPRGDLYVKQCGIGKVNAGVGCQQLLDHMKGNETDNVPRLILNTGVAGGTNGVNAVGDIVISERLYYHDVDLTAFGYSYGQLPAGEPAFYAACEERFTLFHIAEEVTRDHEYNAYLGNIATGDQFISGKEATLKIENYFESILALEMEGAAIAQVAHSQKENFVVIRSISDFPANKNNKNKYEEFLSLASKNSAGIILEFVNQKLGMS